MRAMSNATGNDNNEGAPDDDWVTFLSALPSSWVPVATAFKEAFGVVDGRHDGDGSWSLDLSFGLSDVRALLRDAPVTFTAVGTAQDWWHDAHLESESGTLIAREGRAVVAWLDHFSAGVSATLHVCTTDERYELLLGEMHRAQEGNDEDAESDGDDVDAA